MILFGLFWAQQSLYTAPSAHFALTLFAKLNRWEKFQTKIRNKAHMFIIVCFVSFSLPHTHARPVCLSAVRFSFLSYEHKKFFYCTVGAKTFHFVLLLQRKWSKAVGKQIIC